MRGDASRAAVVPGRAVSGGTCRSCRSELMGSFPPGVGGEKNYFRPGFKQETGEQERAKDTLT